MHSNSAYEQVQRNTHIERRNSARSLLKESINPNNEIFQYAKKLIQLGFRVTPMSGTEKYQLGFRVTSMSGTTKYQEEQQSRILQDRVIMLCKELSSMSGISCPFVDGVMYAFPRIVLPPEIVIDAKGAGKDPDVFYCLELLEQARIVAIPSFSSAQSDGTWHFHMVICPAAENFDDVFNDFKAFHTKFMQKYQDFKTIGYDDDLGDSHSSALSIAPVASKL